MAAAVVGLQPTFCAVALSPVHSTRPDSSQPVELRRIGRNERRFTIIHSDLTEIRVIVNAVDSVHRAENG